MTRHIASHQSRPTHNSYTHTRDVTHARMHGRCEFRPSVVCHWEVHPSESGTEEQPAEIDSSRTPTLCRVCMHRHRTDGLTHAHTRVCVSPSSVLVCSSPLFSSMMIVGRVALVRSQCCGIELK